MFITQGLSVDPVCKATSVNTCTFSVSIFNQGFSNEFLIARIRYAFCSRYSLAYLVDVIKHAVQQHARFILSGGTHCLHALSFTITANVTTDIAPFENRFTQGTDLWSRDLIGIQPGILQQLMANRSTRFVLNSNTSVTFSTVQNRGHLMVTRDSVSWNESLTGE